MTVKIPGSGVDPARAAALQVLCLSEKQGTSLDDQINALATAVPTTDAADGLDARDLRLVRQLCVGVTKWRLRLDWLLAPHSRRPVDELSPTVRQALRMALYQMQWLDRVPDRAAVHTAVELTKHIEHSGAAGYVNAVLRGLMRAKEAAIFPHPEREPANYLSVYHSHPRWLVERWLNRWGLAATTALLEANNLQPALYVHRHTLRADHEQFMDGLPEGTKARQLDEATYEITAPEGFFQCRTFRNGFCFVQDLQAACAIRQLAPAPGQQLLDLCAAPGGKAVQAAIASADEARIVAIDPVATRLGLLRESCQRLGLNSIHCLAAIGEHLPLLPQIEFDGILVDAPCSGTGVLRRRADARWHKQPGDLARHARRQLRLLRTGFDRLRPGGILVYSTCSLEREENEDVVETFLAKQPAARLEPLASEATSDLPGEPSSIPPPLFHHSLPGRDAGDGAFTARLRKVIAC